jgi:hypothetical protein
MSGELEAFFGKPLLADLDHVFNARPGPALRHSLAHGLLHDRTPYDANAIYGCWLMFHICVAPLHHIRDQLQLPFDD